MQFKGHCSIRLKVIIADWIFKLNRNEKNKNRITSYKTPPTDIMA